MPKKCRVRKFVEANENSRRQRCRQLFEQHIYWTLFV